MSKVVVVTGSRSLARHPDRFTIKMRFIDQIADLDPVEVHHGGAEGPDSWAWDAFYPIHVMHRPSNNPLRTPAQRLFDRNMDMIDAAIERGRVLRLPVVVVSCYDGSSKGTRHAVEYAEAFDLRVIPTHMDIERKK